MGCCPSAPKNAMNLDDVLDDEDAAGAKISKKEKRKQDKKRLNNAPDSASFSEEPMEPEERDMKLRTKQKRTLRAKMNAAIAGRMASSKPKSHAQQLHTDAALDPTLQTSDQLQSAAFEAFLRWEDKVQRAAQDILKHPMRAKVPRKPDPRKPDPVGSMFTLIAMEEQTRNTSFVTVMQTQHALFQVRLVQGKGLRDYGLLCDTVINKLSLRLPAIPKQKDPKQDIAPLVSAYTSAIAQHRDLAKAARPDGFVT
ncbi:hypothetical protein Ctob_002229 [Chrysochromulina tobinii]|uniref:Uncharacterized protein n=1 Tax=Chrysochromulina tobinii TaxID=1460289 RepID=A0A0M0JHW6_9EUKA|nr:hypothetical protein Ctob_002229 [Chrysochromulina tobinii]|eukprot:KOO25927.1 hypothetical protein Ctob_002229 [Chrysochromulina sp. CCMP291]